MQHNAVRLTLCGILLVLVACAPQPAFTPTPTLVPAPTDTPQPPTATRIPLTPISTTIPPQLISEIDTMLGMLAKQHHFSGSVLIARQGEVLLSQGYGLADREQNIPNTAQTRFRIGSITKQITAMAILILASRGQLKVEDPICNYLANCPPTWQTLTIHHLLIHTSGIPNFTSLPDFASTQATPASPEQIIARFKDLPLDFKPGEKWSYSNSGYIILGYIIERVSGESYEAFLQQSILTPLNLRNTGYDHNSNGVAVGYRDPYLVAPVAFVDMSLPYAAGALYSTVEDLNQWDSALYTQQLVPQAYLDQMFVPHITFSGNGGAGYGYGWEINTERGRRITWHSGGIEGFSTIIARYPDEQIVIIVLSNENYKDVLTIKNILSKKIFGDK